jgi:hypothetical protein
MSILASLSVGSSDPKKKRTGMRETKTRLLRVFMDDSILQLEKRGHCSKRQAGKKDKITYV